ncbi:MAG: M42 family metallopeptidase [Thermomicrobiales bacterium]|nr:M42 family metallopeptidase [Thermomicrobiales bacterium]
MEQRAFEFLRRLLDAPGPSGFEERPSRVWREEAAAFADEVDRDVLGNSWARLKNEGAPVMVIEGHIDEIGLMVTLIDENGYLLFDAIGGWDTQVIIGQRMLVLGRNGDVHGVVGRKAPHGMSAEDKNRVPELRDLWIDIGASSKEDAEARVEIGDAIVIDAPFRQLTSDLVVARSLDNRVGAFVALEALRLLADDRPAFDTYAVTATQEEIAFAGAHTTAFQLSPTAAIVIDVTHATDYPGADKWRNGDVKMAAGPVVGRGSVSNAVVYRALGDYAQQNDLPIQRQANPRSSGTDADAMYLTGSGTAIGLVSIPNRYMHSPNETVSLTDLDNAARLIAGFIKSLPADFDFRP